MNTQFRIVAAFLLGFLGNSIATPIISNAEAESSAEPVLMALDEQQQHVKKMAGMSHDERNKYRNEQYEILRKRAAEIGYIMPITPPWAGMEESAQQPVLDTAAERHQQQLAKYRQDAADKRKAMEERLEKQKQTIKQRIDKLVQDNAVKATDDVGKAYRPVYPGFMPPPPPPPGPGYPGFYRVPPPYPSYRY